MAKFHVNGNSEAKPCTATKRACRFGSEDHFDSAKDAMAEAERRVREDTGESTVATLRNTPSESHMNLIERRIRFPKVVDSESIAKTARDVSRFFSSEHNHRQRIRIEDRTGNAVGVNFISYEPSTKEYAYGVIRTGFVTNWARSTDPKVVIQDAADRLGFDDDEKLDMDWDS
jgi:hypothetical protein